DRPGPAGEVLGSDPVRPAALPGAAGRARIRGAAGLLRHREEPAAPAAGRAGALRHGRRCVPVRPGPRGTRRPALVASPPAAVVMTPAPVTSPPARGGAAGPPPGAVRNGV